MVKLSLSGPVSSWVTIPGLILLLGFLVFVVNSLGSYFALTSGEAALVGFIGLVLAGLVTLLKEEEEEAPTPAPSHM